MLPSMQLFLLHEEKGKDSSLDLKCKVFCTWVCRSFLSSFIHLKSTELKKEIISFLNKYWVIGLTKSLANQTPAT